MKILVLGNGFDLDHDLPTSYSDFLNFCNCVLSMDTAKYDSEKRELKESQISYICKLEEDTDLKSRFTDLLKNNHLLNYFNIQKIKTGKNWIDLEREIKSIISEFRIVEAELKKSNQSSYALSKEHKIQSVLRELGLNGLGGKELNAIKLEIRARFKHFDMAYWEMDFNIQYNRQMMEAYEERKKNGEEDI